VVNPLGVAEPTVGWKRAPLSAVVSPSEVISDKCFSFGILKFICILIIMLIMKTVNDLIIRMSVWCYDQ
jgi:hypothetical protein